MIQILFFPFFLIIKMTALPMIIMMVMISINCFKWPTRYAKPLDVDWELGCCQRWRCRWIYRSTNTGLLKALGSYIDDLCKGTLVDFICWLSSLARNFLFLSGTRCITRMVWNHSFSSLGQSVLLLLIGPCDRLPSSPGGVLVHTSASRNRNRR